MVLHNCSGFVLVGIFLGLMFFWCSLEGFDFLSPFYHPCHLNPKYHPRSSVRNRRTAYNLTDIKLSIIFSPKEWIFSSRQVFSKQLVFSTV